MSTLLKLVNFTLPPQARKTERRIWRLLFALVIPILITALPAHAGPQLTAFTATIDGFNSLTGTPCIGGDVTIGAPLSAGTCNGGALPATFVWSSGPDLRRGFGKLQWE